MKLENSWIYLLFPAVLAVLACANLFDELMTRYLHKAGTPGEGTVAEVKRSLPKDRFRVLVPRESDASNTYDVKCDYILSLKYSDDVGREILIRDLIVPATIKMSGGMGFPIFKAGDSVPIRYSKKHPKHAVIAMESVKRAQSKPLELIVWIVCALAALIMLIAMLITK